MKSKILIIALIIGTSAFSQHTHNVNDTIKKKSRTYISLKYYKLKFKKELTKKDSLSFIFKGNDTLVLIDNYAPKGVSVPYEQKDSIFLKYYKKIAFNHKTDSLAHKTRMKYWKDDIKIFFSKSVSKNIQKDLMEFTSIISNNIDSLNIHRVKKIEDSNYIIYYKGDYEYEPRMQNYKNSSYYMHWNGKSQIYRNTIKISNDGFFNDKLKLNKIKKLFIQSLGHFKFLKEFECINYFSDCNSFDNIPLSKLDLEILKYHYSYGICKGTTQKTFERQHTEAKRTLKLTGRKMLFLHSN